MYYLFTFVLLKALNKINNITTKDSNDNQFKWSVLDEPSVNKHWRSFPSESLVRHVFIPESIIVIIVVYGLLVGYLSGFSLDVLDLSVGFPVEVGHTGLDLWLNLERSDIQLAGVKLLSFRIPIVFLNHSQHAICN
jgi:hypothetical protein